MVGPTGSSRPATTGSTAPGSQTQTKATSGSEVIVDLARLTGPARQNREPVRRPSQLSREARPLLVEEGHAGQRRGLEADAKADTRVATLDLAQGDDADPHPFGQLLDSPAAFEAPDPDLGAEELCRLNGAWGVIGCILHQTGIIISVRYLYRNNNILKG